MGARRGDWATLGRVEGNSALEIQHVGFRLSATRFQFTASYE